MNNIQQSAISPNINNKINDKIVSLEERKKKYQYSGKTNPLYYNNINDFNTPLNAESNTLYNIKSTNNIQSNTTKPKFSSPRQYEPSNIYNIHQFSSPKKEEDLEKTIKYIKYLKDHLNSSYYANNELNNKNSNLFEKSKFLNDEIKKNKQIYEELLKSVDEKTNENNYYKKQYENILDEQKKIKNNNDNMNLNMEEKIKILKQKNIIMNKDKQSKEEILTNLKKTLNLLEKNQIEKKREKDDKIQKLKEEKDFLDKLKLNIGKITKELYTKNIQLEEKKKSMQFLMNNKNGSSINIIEKNNVVTEDNIFTESDELLNNEIEKLQSIVDNKKLLLNKMKESEKEIRDKINEEKNISKKKKDNNDKYRHLLDEEKLKNKQLVMKLIETDKEAKELTKIHNQIKNKYEAEINKIKDDIEEILKNEKNENQKNKKNDYRMALTKLLEEKKNLQLFHNKFKEKLILKKEIEDKIELLKKENEQLKNQLVNSKSNTNNFKNLPQKNNNIIIDKNINIIENDDNDEYNDDGNKNNIIKENQIKLNIDGTGVIKDSSIYTITDKGKLFTYNIIKKKFTTVNTNIIEGWKDFIEIYLSYCEGSLLLNTFDGLYILTGTNFNTLYFYSQENNIISKIISFNYGHKYGGLIMSPNKKELIVLGGCETKEVEVLNIEDNTIEELPNLLSERINSSYSFIGENLLYAFFGQNNNSIEYLDLNEEFKEWKNVEYTGNDIKNIFGHISVPVNDKEIIIVGGKNNRKMMMFNVNEQYLEITDNKIPFLENVGEYLFDKDKNYNIIINLNKTENEISNTKEKDIHQFICMDSKGNVHLFDNDFTYIVLLVDMHEI